MFLIKNTFNEKILFIIILYSIITPLFAEIVQSEKKNAISVYMLAPFFSDMDMTSDNTILNYTNPLLFGFEYNYDNFSAYINSSGISCTDVGTAFVLSNLFVSANTKYVTSLNIEEETGSNSDVLDGIKTYEANLNLIYNLNENHGMQYYFKKSIDPHSQFYFSPGLGLLSSYYRFNADDNIIPEFSPKESSFKTEIKKGEVKSIALTAGISGSTIIADNAFNKLKIVSSFGIYIGPQYTSYSMFEKNVNSNRVMILGRIYGYLSGSIYFDEYFSYVRVLVNTKHNAYETINKEGIDFNTFTTSIGFGILF